MLGNGTPENSSSPAPLDPLDSFSPRSDGADESPSLSHYSSCGESEFDRYCSANSTMGTPSLCGSSVVESDLGSMMKSLESFKLEGRKVSSFGADNDRTCGSDCEDASPESGSDAVNKGFGPRLGEKDDEEDGDGDDDDDSMYGCGSDDENRSLYVHRGGNNVIKNENANPLLINSSVAFGTDDFDDFDQEIGGGGLVSLAMDGFPKQKDHHFDAQVEHFDSTTMAAIKSLSFRGEEVGNDRTEQSVCTREVEGDKVADDAVTLASRNLQFNQVHEVKDIPVASSQIECAPESTEENKTTSKAMFSFPKEEQDDVVEIHYNPLQDSIDRNEHSCSANDVFDLEQDPLLEKTSMVSGVNAINPSSVKSEESAAIDRRKALENQGVGTLEVEADPLSEKSNQLFSRPDVYSEAGAELFEEGKRNSIPSMDESNTSKTSENDPALFNHLNNGSTPKADNHEFNEFYDEIVNEMEEILLDSGESPGSRFPHGNCIFQSPLSLPQRDGGSTASTSGTDVCFPLITQPLRIDGIEVVGAKQKKGDVSLSERLVGVKEYTVYVIRVWSVRDQWEVERRYRDFYTLYRRLKSFFADQGWTLPAPWSTVEKESRKIFGNVSPDVISERSNLIQECLRSVLHSGLFSTPPSALTWFLCPQDALPSSPASKTSAPWSLFMNVEADTENISTWGKTISLVVEIQPHKSVKQMLEAQHYACAGCHRHFDDGMTLMRDFVQTLGWGKPRLCEYTGQLFCSTCHTNDTAVLPARVLHYWDFNRYPVSQLAKSYLDSIHEQPMLCVSAVNPFLFSKVPALHHVMNIRKKIGTMLPYVRCPFRRTIQKGLGSRRYLLEGNDFFALKDLVDLSKGPFSALPVMVETVSRKILEHITEQCLVCCDVGVPCNARQACNDPSSLIFPFQEGEIERCAFCESVFHKPCFGKLANCTCGADLGASNAVGAVNSLSRKASEYLLGRQSSSGLPGRLLSGLFSKTDSGKAKDQKDRDTVILMGSLPSTSL